MTDTQEEFSVGGYTFLFDNGKLCRIDYLGEIWDSDPLGVYEVGGEYGAWGVLANAMLSNLKGENQMKPLNSKETIAVKSITEALIDFGSTLLIFLGAAALCVGILFVAGEARGEEVSRDTHTPLVESSSTGWLCFDSDAVMEMATSPDERTPEGIALRRALIEERRCLVFGFPMPVDVMRSVGQGSYGDGPAMSVVELRFGPGIRAYVMQTTEDFEALAGDAL